MYEANLVIDGIEYRHVEGYLRSIMFLNVNKDTMRHVRAIQSPYACRRASSKYVLGTHEAALWKTKNELEHMKIATTVKFIGSSEFRQELLSTGSRPLVCCDPEYGTGQSTKLLGSVLEGIRSIAQGIHILELSDPSTTAYNNNEKPCTKSVSDYKKEDENPKIATVNTVDKEDDAKENGTGNDKESKSKENNVTINGNKG